MSCEKCCVCDCDCSVLEEQVSSRFADVNSGAPQRQKEIEITMESNLPQYSTYIYILTILIAHTIILFY